MSDPPTVKLRAGEAIVNAEQEEALLVAIGRALGRERQLARQERQQELRALERQIDELRGSVQALLALNRDRQ
jgi:hypothetical protein